MIKRERGARKKTDDKERGKEINGLGWMGVHKEKSEVVRRGKWGKENSLKLCSKVL